MRKFAFVAWIAIAWVVGARADDAASHGNPLQSVPLSALKATRERPLFSDLAPRARGAGRDRSAGAAASSRRRLGRRAGGAAVPARGHDRRRRGACRVAAQPLDQRSDKPSRRRKSPWDGSAQGPRAVDPLAARSGNATFELAQVHRRGRGECGERRAGRPCEPRHSRPARRRFRRRAAAPARPALISARAGKTADRACG